MIMFKVIEIILFLFFKIKAPVKIERLYITPQNLSITKGIVEPVRRKWQPFPTIHKHRLTVVALPPTNRTAIGEQ